MPLGFLLGTTALLQYHVTALLGIHVLAAQQAAAAHASHPSTLVPVMYPTISHGHSLVCLCRGGFWRVCADFLGFSPQLLYVRGALSVFVGVGVHYSSAQSTVCACGAQCVLGFHFWMALVVLLLFSFACI
jgi:hypothetical protein